MSWRWLIAGLIAGYIWGFGARADRAREEGREDGVRAAWEACESWAAGRPARDVRP